MSSFIEKIKNNTVEYLIVTILIGSTIYSIKSWYDLGKDYKDLTKSYSESIKESKESIVAIKQCLRTVMVKQGIDPESMKDLIAFDEIGRSERRHNGQKGHH